MTIDTPRSLISIAIAALTGWAFYEIGHESVRLLLAVTTAVLTTIALIMSIGMSPASKSHRVARVVSGLFLVISLIVNGIFACFNFSTTPYIIVNGLVLCLYTATVVSVIQSKQ